MKNGIRLHFDSILLYENKRYPTAHFVSVLSMEEVGKAIALEFYVWNSKVNPRSDPKSQNEWLAVLLTDHRNKQLAFMRNVWHNSDAMKKLTESIQAKQLDTLKQNAMYVGISKPQAGKARTEGKIHTPERVIDKPKARRQLLLVHEYLLEEAVDTGVHDKDHNLKSFKKIYGTGLKSRLEEVQL